MTLEDLLEPRYKIIAEWPHCSMKKGSIYSAVFLSDFRPHIYPHLFIKLEWWEDRDEKDLPEYVKSRSKVYKVKWENYLGVMPKDTEAPSKEFSLSIDWHFIRKEILPATEEEYKTQ